MLAGTAGPRRGEGLTWAGQQADAPADRRLEGRTTRRPEDPADSGQAAPAPRPEWIPSREGQIERESEEEEEEEAARGGEEGGSAREQGGGAGRPPAGRGTRKRAGTDSPPVTGRDQCAGPSQTLARGPEGRKGAEAGTQ